MNVTELLAEIAKIPAQHYDDLELVIIMDEGQPFAVHGVEIGDNNLDAGELWIVANI